MVNACAFADAFTVYSSISLEKLFSTLLKVKYQVEIVRWWSKYKKKHMHDDSRSAYWICKSCFFFHTLSCHCECGQDELKSFLFSQSFPLAWTIREMMMMMMNNTNRRPLRGRSCSHTYAQWNKEICIDEKNRMYRNYFGKATLAKW